MPEPIHPRPIPPIPPLPYTPPILQRIPDKLVLWLMENLSDENQQKHIVQTTLYRQRPKGIRPQAIPREKMAQILAGEFQRNIAFRIGVGATWVNQKKKDMGILTEKRPDEIAQSYSSWIERMGFPFLYWYGMFHKAVVLQRMSIRMIQESSVQSPEGLDKQVQKKGTEAKESKESDRLRSEKEKLIEENKHLSAQITLEKGAVKRLESEIVTLKTRLRQMEKVLEGERQNEKDRQEKISGMDQKIRTLSDAGQTIHNLEKKSRSLEHDLTAARRFAQEIQEKLATSAHDRDVSGTLEGEMRKTISTLFRFLARTGFHEESQGKSKESGKEKFVGSGQTLVVVGDQPQLAGEYYKQASSAGITLLYHAGFKRNLDLEKRVAKAWQVILFVSGWEEAEKHMDLIGFLRKNSCPFFILPPLSPEVFLSFIKEI